MSTYTLDSDCLPSSTDPKFLEGRDWVFITVSSKPRHRALINDYERVSGVETFGRAVPWKRGTVPKDREKPKDAHNTKALSQAAASGELISLRSQCEG